MSGGKIEHRCLTVAFAGGGKRGGGARRGAEEARRGPPLTRDDASEDELEAAVEVPAAVSEGGRTRGGAGREGLQCEAPIRPELAARPWQGGCAREREAEAAPAAVSEGGRTRGGAGREGLRCEAPIRPELAARPWQGGCAREREAEVAARKAERDLRSDGVRAVPCGGAALRASCR